MKKLLVLLLFPVALSAQNKIMYTTPYEKGNGNQTATYQETKAYFQKLDEGFESIQMQAIGSDDNGMPLHIVIYNPDKNFNLPEVRKTKAILLLNNGIHPGEPDGIDATMMLYRDLATGKIAIPKNTVIVNIPIYNISGALNRNSHSRANQNGPESYGFRGNARNYDLNRDFVKCDTKNARSFAEIFHKVKPDVFIDNHVSNGADYQYIFTYIATHHQKLGGALGQYFKAEMMPAILDAMKAKGIEATPYVNIHDEKPDNGFEQFMDYPRYSTGYASLFNVPGSMPETHMLKKYADRVKVTYEYMLETLAYTDTNFKTIKESRLVNRDNYMPGNRYTLQWSIDSSQVSLLPFLGYEGSYKPSEVTGQQRLYYDRTKPFKKVVKYYQEYKPALEVTIPKSYVIPQSWWNIIDLLKLNNIQLQQLQQDTEIEVESYRIGSYETSKQPYEGHYLHSKTQIAATIKKVLFHKGDYVIDTAQPGVKYIIEMLEPQGVDSFFTWNFFDAILQQKEYYSAYVFEDTAAKLLKDNPKLKAEFDTKKLNDKAFAWNTEAQLDWIYTNSVYFEKQFMEYPVYRVLK
ncbi:M14 family metallopeptidase [Flavobacterium psychrotrophum]|uniref:M14 family metallopeptidase n=1 Tax=Flavobacterium psychrotrophum TaxID=2294119 RepID=UPI000E31F80E|nr:M14 family metallopeptidase [Flavobacterium psychrotrophum]